MTLVDDQGVMKSFAWLEVNPPRGCQRDGEFSIGSFLRVLGSGFWVLGSGLVEDTARDVEDDDC